VVGVRPNAVAQTWPGRDSFDTQPEAQAFWESHGRPAVADGEGGRCESLPAGEEGGEYERPRGIVTVRLSRRRYAEATLHFEVAWRQGVPRRYTIARGRAHDDRDAWQPLVPAGVDADGDGEEDDRDEVPMAFTKVEDARRQTATRPRTSPTSTPAGNRGAGSLIGGRLRKYCQRHSPQGEAGRPAQAAGRDRCGLTGRPPCASGRAAALSRGLGSGGGGLDQRGDLVGFPSSAVRTRPTWDQGHGGGSSERRFDGFEPSMRRIGRDDDDVARARLPLLVARREGALPLLQG
jgi:hypothetical protein